MDWLLVDIPGTNLPVLFVVGVVGAWLLLRNRATELSSSDELDEIVGAGNPVVLEFFGKL